MHDQASNLPMFAVKRIVAAWAKLMSSNSVELLCGTLAIGAASAFDTLPTSVEAAIATERAVLVLPLLPNKPSTLRGAGAGAVVVSIFRSMEP